MYLTSTLKKIYALNFLIKILVLREHYYGHNQSSCFRVSYMKTSTRDVAGLQLSYENCIVNVFYVQSHFEKC